MSVSHSFFNGDTVLCGFTAEKVMADGDTILVNGWPSCENCKSIRVGRLIANGEAKAFRISFLERKREATKADLLLKFEDGDWHGTADAAMDMRDIDCELKGLRF